MTQERDQQIEQQIQEIGLNAPRVKAEHIDQIMEKVVYNFTQVSEKRVICQGVLGNFWIADGNSVSVDPKNFNLKLAKEISLESAKEAVRKKLWEFEGWRLFISLNKDILKGISDIEIEAQ